MAVDLTGPGQARTTDPDTSVEAARPDRTTDRQRVLRWHREHPEGATDFELAAALHGAQTSLGVRRAELKRLGLIEDSGRRRPAPSGSSAIVWRITQPTWHPQHLDP